MSMPNSLLSNKNKINFQKKYVLSNPFHERYEQKKEFANENNLSNIKMNNTNAPVAKSVLQNGNIGYK